MIMAAAAQKEFKDTGGMDRARFLFDTSEESSKEMYGKQSWFMFNAKQDKVDVFESFGLNDPHVYCKTGLFDCTAPEIQTDPLGENCSLLHIDGNF